MLEKIEQWIDQTNLTFSKQRICCDRFAEAFEGFYPAQFLQNSFFVALNEIPKPAFQELRQMGLGDFMDMELSGITYKNTYYIRPHAIDDVQLHFHELVHVAQWQILGAHNFIQRYIYEIQNFGYNKAPLEIMAYSLDNHFTKGGNTVDIPRFVAEKI